MHEKQKMQEIMDEETKMSQKQKMQSLNEKKS